MTQGPLLVQPWPAAECTAQWIEYYKSLGMHSHAEALDEYLEAIRQEKRDLMNKIDSF